jgi:hypothetical protein
MGRTYAYFISLLFFLITSLQQIKAQDTILFPLKIKAGLEVSGPVMYLIEKTNISNEVFVSADISEKYSAALSAGYLNYTSSQSNYKYVTTGSFVRAGLDINLMKPEKSMGKYWIGLGLRYGISHFTSVVPSFELNNYWGSISASIDKRTDWVHFIEASPGVRAELFKNFSIGWSINVRMLLLSTANKDLKPTYVPGFGSSSKALSLGASYFMSLSIPYKKIIVIKKAKPPEPEDTEDTKKPVSPDNNRNPDNRQQPRY